MILITEEVDRIDPHQDILLLIHLEIRNIFHYLVNPIRDMPFPYNLELHLPPFQDGEDLDRGLFRVQERNLDNIQV